MYVFSTLVHLDLVQVNFEGQGHGSNFHVTGPKILLKWPVRPPMRTFLVTERFGGYRAMKLMVGMRLPIGTVTVCFDITMQAVNGLHCSLCSARSLPTRLVDCLPNT